LEPTPILAEDAVVDDVLALEDVLVFVVVEVVVFVVEVVVPPLISFKSLV
jgi:hypothetical protein